MSREVKNNRIHIDGQPTNQYVCDVCGDIVSDLRTTTIFGEEKCACSECREDIEKYEERTEELYISYFNDYGTLLRFAQDYRLNVAVAKILIAEGKRKNLLNETKDYSFNIGKHFPCLIEYGNEGGYTDEDEKNVDIFLKNINSLMTDIGASSYSIFYDDSEGEHFTRCEISHLQDDCVEAKVTFFFEPKLFA